MAVDIKDRHIAHALREMPLGNSWRGEHQGFSINGLRDSAGLLLTGATAPIAEVSSGEYRVRAVASTSHTMTAAMHVPRDYDYKGSGPGGVAVPELKVQLCAYGSAGIDAQSLTLAVKATPMAGGSSRTIVVPAAVGVVAGAASLLTVTYTWDLAGLVDASGNPILPGDTLSLTWTFTTGGTDALNFTQARCFYSKMPNFALVSPRHSIEGTEQTQ